MRRLFGFVLFALVALPGMAIAQYPEGVYPRDSSIPIHEWERTLTIAEVITLNTSPITIAPAVVGKIHIPFFFSAKRNGAAYKTAGGTFALYGGVFDWGTATPTTFLTSATTPNYELSMTASGRAPNDYSGRALVVHVNTGNPTVDGGSPGSTVDMHVYYVTINATP